MSEALLIPDQVYVDPNNHRWVWDADNKRMKNLSAEAEPSPAQAVKDFQTRHARFRAQVFSNRAGGSYPEVELAAPTLPHLRRSLRAVLIHLLAVKDPALGVQYNVWDFHDEVWIDPSTGSPLPEAFAAGLMNAELKVGGGFGDEL